MPPEPITIFARIADPRGVARLLRERAPGVVFDGPDDRWGKAVFTVGKWWARRTLTITHDPAYYSEPNWSVQMNGMRGYFARFPESDRRHRAMALTGTFRFALATAFDPDYDPAGDPRLDLLFAVTEILDGVLFTPSSLRDARGCILFSVREEDVDPDARWPSVLAEATVPERATTAAEEDGNLRPPTAERVARRALALTALTARAVLEQDVAKANPDVPRLHDGLRGWIHDTGTENELEPDELRIVLRRPGAPDSKQLADSTWRLEGLAILAWALGRFEIPSHDELVSMNQLWRSLGFLDSRAAKAVLDGPSLRPRGDIAKVRNRLFALHWRLRNFHLNRGTMDFAEFARTCWFGPLDLGGLPLVEGDLAIKGERIDRAPASAFSSALSAAQERHQAANWLWEGPERYSDASVAT